MSSELIEAARQRKPQAGYADGAEIDEDKISEERRKDHG